jgi:hypothetical protein
MENEPDEPGTRDESVEPEFATEPAIRAALEAMDEMQALWRTLDSLQERRKPPGGDVQLIRALAELSTMCGIWQQVGMQTVALTAGIQDKARAVIGLLQARIKPSPSGTQLQ